MSSPESAVPIRSVEELAEQADQLWRLIQFLDTADESNRPSVYRNAREKAQRLALDLADAAKQ